MVKEYERARRSYSPKVFSFLKKFVSHKESLILDLGCGTGISTRQLAKFGKVIGCDPDQMMLRAARRHKSVGQEKYVMGLADDLPFVSSTFDVVTAFSAFHWFNDKSSIREIKRVLKPGGIMFVVNRVGVKSWGEGYRQAIMNAINQKIANFKNDSCYPRKSLLRAGFKNVKTKQFKRVEIFKLANALDYVQSVSIWNSVPASQKIKAQEGLKKYFKQMQKSKGKIERRLTVRVVVGKK